MPFLFALSTQGVGQETAPETPVIAAASDEASNAISGFKLPEGWKVELFAAEPDIANPVAFYVDGKGRLFICESFRQNNGVTDNRGHDNEWLMADLAAKTVQDRIDYHRRLLPDKGKSYTTQDDRIRMIVDRDGDGKGDESVVFASGFNQLEDGTGAGVLVRGNTAYYTCIPKVWMLDDKNGDGVAEERKVLSDGYGVRVAFRGHDMHGLVVGPDGRLYFSIGDRGYHVQTPNGLLHDPASGAVFRCELDGSNLEIFATGLRNPQELAFDDHGRLFTGDNNSDSGDKARWVYIVQGGDTGWRMYYQYHKTRGPFNRENIWKPFSDKTPAYTIPPVDNIADGPSGLTYYPGTGLNESYRNTFFLCDFRGQASNSGIRAIKLAEKGAFFEIASNEQSVWNVLATDADFGPDGSLYVTDWVNGWNGEGKGRIYRFFDPAQKGSAEAKSTREILANGFEGQSEEAIAKFLTHPDRRVRFEAQWKLAALLGRSQLQKLAADSTQAETVRLHGVWGLGQLARSKGEVAEAAQKDLAKLLTDSQPWIIATAIQMLADARAPIANESIVQAIHSENVHVRYHAALAAGRLSIDNAFDEIVGLLIANQDTDPILRHAGIMGLYGQKDVAKVIALKSHPSASVRLAAVVALRKRKEPRVAEFLQDTEMKVAVEAARAVHDLSELHSQLPALANRLRNSGSNEALARRSLNAHFRLGKKENAIAIAEYAADPRRDEAMRLEAVEMLGDWSEPNALDRVINDYRPLEKRNNTDAVEALRKNLPSIAGAPNDLRTKAFQVATKLGIVEVVPLLQRVIEDVNSPGDQRASALTGLFAMDRKVASPLIPKLIEDKATVVRVAAMKLMVESDPTSALPFVRKGIQSKVVLERQAAWDLVSSLKASDAEVLVEEGVAKYLDNTLPRDCRLNVLELARERVRGDQKAQLLRLLDERKGLSQSNPTAAYADCAEGGDFLAGRDLFFNRSQLSCVRCHKVMERGGEVGPALTAIGKKDADYLLEAIVAPNAKIAEGFDTTVVATEDGEVITGLLKSETNEEISLMNADGVIVKINKEEITARRKGPSSMPPDLMKHLSERELRDLVAYLQGLDGKNPAAMEGSTGGHE